MGKEGFYCLRFVLIHFVSEQCASTILSGNSGLASLTLGAYGSDNQLVDIHKDQHR